MKFFDFNFLPLYGDHRTASHSVGEAVHEPRSNGFRSTPGVHPELRVSALRRSIPRQPLRQGFLLLGSVPLFSFLLNSPVAPASATSKPVCALSKRSSITWVSEVEFLAPLSPMPTRSATGASIATSP